MSLVPDLSRLSSDDGNGDVPAVSSSAPSPLTPPPRSNRDDQEEPPALSSVSPSSSERSVHPASLPHSRQVSLLSNSEEAKNAFSLPMRSGGAPFIVSAKESDGGAEVPSLVSGLVETVGNRMQQSAHSSPNTEANPLLGTHTGLEKGPELPSVSWKDGAAPQHSVEKSTSPTHKKTSNSGSFYLAKSQSKQDLGLAAAAVPPRGSELKNSDSSKAYIFNGVPSSSVFEQTYSGHQCTGYGDPTMVFTHLEPLKRDTGYLSSGVNPKVYESFLKYGGGFSQIEEEDRDRNKPFLVRQLKQVSDKIRKHAKEWTLKQIIWISFLLALVTIGNFLQIIMLNFWLVSFPAEVAASNYTVFALPGVLFFAFFLVVQIAYLIMQRPNMSFAKSFYGGFLLFLVGLTDSVNSWMAAYAASYTSEVLQALFMNLSPIYAVFLSKWILRDDRKYMNPWMIAVFVFTIVGVFIVTVYTMVKSPTYGEIAWILIFFLSIPLRVVMNVWQSLYMIVFTYDPTFNEWLERQYIEEEVENAIRQQRGDVLLSKKKMRKRRRKNKTAEKAKSSKKKRRPSHHDSKGKTLKAGGVVASSGLSQSSTISPTPGHEGSGEFTVSSTLPGGFSGTFSAAHPVEVLPTRHTKSQSVTLSAQQMGSSRTHLVAPTSILGKSDSLEGNPDPLQTPTAGGHGPIVSGASGSFSKLPHAESSHGFNATIRSGMDNNNSRSGKKRRRKRSSLDLNLSQGVKAPNARRDSMADSSRRTSGVALHQSWSSSALPTLGQQPLPFLRQAHDEEDEKEVSQTMTFTLRAQRSDDGGRMTKQFSGATSAPLSPAPAEVDPSIRDAEEDGSDGYEYYEEDEEGSEVEVDYYNSPAFYYSELDADGVRNVLRSGASEVVFKGEEREGNRALGLESDGDGDNELLDYQKFQQEQRRRRQGRVIGIGTGIRLGGRSVGYRPYDPALQISPFQKHYKELQEREGDDTSVKIFMLSTDTFWQLIVTLLLLPADALPWYGNSKNVGVTWHNFLEGVDCVFTIRENAIYGVMYTLGFVFTYLGSAYLNHYSVALCAIVTQLSSPVTALILVIIPSWNQHGQDSPPWFLSLISIVMLSVAALIYVVWEEKTDEEKKEGEMQLKRYKLKL